MSEMAHNVGQAVMDKLRPVLTLMNYQALAAYDIKPEDIARAAIEAMREPNRAMVDAVWNNGDLVTEFSTFHASPKQNIEEDTAYEVWQRMIDEALK